MGNNKRFDELLRAVAALCLLRDSHRVDASDVGGAAALEGRVTVAGRDVTLRLILDASFPLTLPRFVLQPWNSLGFIPHVTQQGIICYRDAEGLLLDRYRPEQIVAEAFELVLHTLEQGATGRNCADFADEFEWYWATLLESQTVQWVGDPGYAAARIPVVRHEQEVFIGGEYARAAYWNGVQQKHTDRLGEAVYLPLEPGTVLVPPTPGGPMWSMTEARLALLQGLSGDQRARLEEILKQPTHFNEYVIVMLPRPSGGFSLFGIRYDGVHKRHPLLDGSYAGRLVPLQVRRLDREYLLGRGGGQARLGMKRVLIVGCGAVGAPLALELAHGGVTKLTLVDDDTITADNAFRHPLGRSSWGFPKVAALKVDIETQLPYVSVKPINSKIEKALAERAIQLCDYDLVVLATGNPTVELDINCRVYALQGQPAVLFTWVEPFGIGGHALLAHNGPSGGCFECLYTPLDGDADDTLKNRAAFAAPGQSFGRALSGCGSLHTPYGAIDARQTALLAARLAIDALTGKEHSNPLHSWRGDGAAFTTAGFRFSSRFGASEEELQHLRYAYRNPRCPICNRVAGKEA